MAKAAAVGEDRVTHTMHTPSHAEREKHVNPPPITLTHTHLLEDGGTAVASKRVQVGVREVWEVRRERVWWHT